MVLPSHTPCPTMTLYLVIVVGQLQSQLPPAWMDFVSIHLPMKGQPVILPLLALMFQYQQLMFLAVVQHLIQIQCKVPLDAIIVNNIIIMLFLHNNTLHTCRSVKHIYKCGI